MEYFRSPCEMCETQEHLKARLSYQQDTTTGEGLISAACSCLHASCVIQVRYLGYVFSHCRGKEVPPKGNSFHPQKVCLKVSFAEMSTSVAKLG